MQDAIILYENGKAIGGEGHPTNASDITFDNTGTDLDSENVENAIKEVNDNTKHGFYGVWKNESTNAFAGQTFSVITDKEFDSFLVDYGDTSNYTSRGTVACEVGTNAVLEYVDIGSGGNIGVYMRTFSCTKTSTGYSFTVTDCTFTLRNNNGTTTTSTTNQYNAPIRILGLIHND